MDRLSADLERTRSAAATAAPAEVAAERRRGRGSRGSGLWGRSRTLGSSGRIVEISGRTGRVTIETDEARVVVPVRRRRDRGRADRRAGAAGRGGRCAPAARCRADLAPARPARRAGGGRARAAGGYLDEALLAGLDEAVIVHGAGTGALRRSIREYLADHPRVRDTRPGRREEGGDGATVARALGLGRRGRRRRRLASAVGSASAPRSRPALGWASATVTASASRSGTRPACRSRSAPAARRSRGAGRAAERRLVAAPALDPASVGPLPGRVVALPVDQVEEDLLAGAPVTRSPGWSPQPSCQILPLSSSISRRSCRESCCCGWLDVAKISVTVVRVKAPGSSPLMASTCASTMPSGRGKSRSGRSAAAVTSAM